MTMQPSVAFAPPLSPDPDAARYYGHAVVCGGAHGDLDLRGRGRPDHGGWHAGGGHEARGSLIGAIGRQNVRVDDQLARAREVLGQRVRGHDHRRGLVCLTRVTV